MVAIPRPEDPPFCRSCLEDPDPRGGSACNECRVRSVVIGSLRKLGHIVWARRDVRLHRPIGANPAEFTWHAYDLLDLDDRSETREFPDADAFCYHQASGLERHQWTKDGSTITAADACPVCALLAPLPPTSKVIDRLDQVEHEMRVDAHARRANHEGIDFRMVANLVLDPGRRVPSWEAPRVLPPLWYETLDPRGEDGTTKYKCSAHRLIVMLSCAIETDGRAWLHLSVSHEKRIPNWCELVLAKEAFLGDREAYKVIPPRARYVNINERVLHVFALLDEKATALPDFTCGTGGL